MDLSSLTISVPTVIAIVGCFIGVMTFLGNRDKNKSEQVKLLTSIDGRLSTIEKNTEAQGKHLEKHDDEIHGLDNRVAVLESKPSRKKGK